MTKHVAALKLRQCSLQTNDVLTSSVNSQQRFVLRDFRFDRPIWHVLLSRNSSCVIKKDTKAAVAKLCCQLTSPALDHLNLCKLGRIAATPQSQQIDCCHVVNAATKCCITGMHLLSAYTSSRQRRLRSRKTGQQHHKPDSISKQTRQRVGAA